MAKALEFCDSSEGMARYRALYDFVAELDSDELTLSQGEKVIAVRANGAEVDEGWLLVQRDDGPTGFVPIRYLEQLSSEEMEDDGDDRPHDTPSMNAETESSEQDTRVQRNEDARDGSGSDEEDDDDDDDDMLPSWGKDDTTIGKVGGAERQEIDASTERESEGEGEEDEGEDADAIPSWAKMDTLNEGSNRDDIIEQEDDGKSRDRIGGLVNVSEMVYAPEDAHSYTDADISLYDLASNNNSFLEDSSTPNIRNATSVTEIIVKDSFGVAMSGGGGDRNSLPLPPDTANRRVVTPGAKSEYRSRLRQRSKGSCLVKPLFISAIESGDPASLSRLTEEYFESIAEGKLQQESLLEELDVLSGMAESSVKNATTLLRRMSDLNDYIDTQKTKVDVSTKLKHREDMEKRAKLLITPKKFDIQLQRSNSHTLV